VATSAALRIRRSVSGPVDSVEIVVNRDSAYAHDLADRFNGLAKKKGATFIEDPYCGLLALSPEVGERRTEFIFDRSHHACKGIVQVAEAGSGFGLANAHLNRRGTVFVCSTHQLINGCDDVIKRSVNRGGESSDVGFETCGPARLQRSLHVRARGTLHKWLDKELRAHDAAILARRFWFVGSLHCLTVC
jgi:hypothetical protein